MGERNPRRRPSPVSSFSSRTTACITCQKQKVRCVMNGGIPPCQRCKKRKVQCISNKIHEDSVESSTLPSNSLVAQDLQMIHAAVNSLLAQNSRPPLGPLQSIGNIRDTVEDLRARPLASPSLPLETAETEPRIVEESTRATNSNESLTQIPINSLYQITKLEALRSRQLPPSQDGASTPRDLVSQGLLTWVDANRLTQAFLNRTSHYLYGIASNFTQVDDVRRASSLLFTAICTVSALHDPSGEAMYRVCNAELRRLVSNFVFTPKVSIDDFRGMCIASFWLSEMAWPISGLAIRRAFEFELQKSFRLVVEPEAEKAAHAQRMQITSKNGALDSLRLWYLLYICDHHMSILYGRPSTFGEQESINNCHEYVKAVGDDNSTDRRIASQIALLLILENVTKLFGNDVNKKPHPLFKAQLDDFNIQLDKWISTWLGRTEKHAHVGDFPAKALTVHFYFAKLFVSSHVFRGLKSNHKVDPIPPEFIDIAMTAVGSARSIIDLIVRDVDIGTAFIGIPHYYHTMIAYACSFLLKVVTKYHRHLGIDRQSIFEAIGQVVTLCQQSHCTQRHLVHWMGRGLQDLLSNCIGAMEERAHHSHGHRQNQTLFGQDNNTEDNAEQQIQDHDSTPGASQSLGSGWDAAREAAMLVPNNYMASFIDRTQPIGDNPEAMHDIVFDPLDPAWGDSMPTFNLEHMGFGLL